MNGPGSVLWGFVQWGRRPCSRLQCMNKMGDGGLVLGKCKRKFELFRGYMQKGFKFRSSDTPCYYHSWGKRSRRCGLYGFPSDVCCALCPSCAVLPGALGGGGESGHQKK